MRFKHCLLLSCLGFCFCQAQAQSTRYFKKGIGDSNPFFEAGQSVNTLGDGYLVGAYSVKGNPYDVDAYIIKSDLSGNTVWQTKILDSLTQSLIFSSVSNGDYFYFAGELPDNINSTDNGYLLKSDSSGFIIWQKSIGDSILNNSIYNIIKTSDGNLVMAGWEQDSTTLDWQGNLIKTDTSGNILWNRTYQGIYNSAITSVLELANGNFALIGRTEYILGSGKVWYLLVDSAGILINSHSYFVGVPSITNVFQVANTLDVAVDSGYIIGGQSGVDPNLIRGLIFKINSTGQVDWFKMLSANSDGTGNIWKSKVTKIKQLPDSSFICTGQLQTGGFQPFKMILIKLDFYGNELWRRSFLSVNGYNTYGYDLDLASDGGFILTGRTEDSTDADVYLVKTNCLGFTNAPSADFSVIWSGNTATFTNLSVRADTCIYYFGDGDSVVVHLTDTTDIVHSYSGPGPWQASIHAFACGEIDTIYQSIATGVNNISAIKNKLLQIYPNPATKSITLNYQLPNKKSIAIIKVIDLNGKIIFNNSFDYYLGQLELDVSSLPSGTYHVVLESGEEKLSKEFIIVK